MNIFCLFLFNVFWFFFFEFVSFQPSLSSYSIHSVFKQFGEIKNILYFEQQLKCETIIEFKTPEGANAAYLKRHIQIGSHTIIVQRFNTFLKKCYSDEVKGKINDILLQPPGEQSPNNILNILNDDCLYEIFKKIPSSNYGSIANVCVRFNRILSEMLSRKYSSSYSLRSTFNISSIVYFELFTLSQAEDYLRNFGSLIYKANINGWMYKPPFITKTDLICKMISDHCENLRSFQINDFVMLNCMANELIPLFTRIEELIVTKTPSSEGPILNFLPAINCPKLIAFQWDVRKFDRLDDIPFVHKFISYNTQLESLEYGYQTKSHCLVNVDFSNLKHLKMLTLFNYESEVYEKSAFFEITHSMKALSSTHAPIECLKLYDTLIDDDAIEYISKIKTIKKFVFDSVNYSKHCSSSRHIIESYIIRLESAFPHLEFLQFRNSFYFDIVCTDINRLEKQLQIYLKVIDLNKRQLECTANTITNRKNLITTQNICHGFYGKITVIVSKVKSCFFLIKCQ